MAADSEYSPKPIDEPVGADIELLIGQLFDHRVTFLIGAGASHGAPTRLPLAEELSRRLYQFFAGGFAREALVGVEADDLLAVSDAVAGASPSGGEKLLQEQTARFEFDSAPPNHGHSVLSLLFAERLITVALTTNFDTCVERAAILSGEGVRPCRDSTEMQLGQDKGRLVKLHGCVTNPSTMRLTSGQLQQPFDWALSEVSVAIQRDALVVVGIGSVAPYIRSTIQRVWADSPKAESVWIVSPTIGQDWNEVLDSPELAHRIEVSAEEFFDDLLRGAVRRQLNALRGIALQLDHERQRGDERQAAVENLASELGKIAADWLVLFFRKRLVPSGSREGAAFDPIAVHALLAVALLQAALGEPLRILRCGDEVHFVIGDLLVELALTRSTVTASTVAQQVRDQIRTAKLRGLLPPDHNRILILSTGHFGQLPTRVAPASILAEETPDHLIYGPQDLNDRWVDLTQVSNASGVEQVKQTLQGVLA